MLEEQGVGLVIQLDPFVEDADKGTPPSLPPSLPLSLPDFLLSVRTSPSLNSFSQAANGMSSSSLLCLTPLPPFIPHRRPHSVTPNPPYPRRFSQRDDDRVGVRALSPTQAPSRPPSNTPTSIKRKQLRTAAAKHENPGQLHASLQPSATSWKGRW
jgi:hypothetical protein